MPEGGSGSDSESSEEEKKRRKHKKSNRKRRKEKKSKHKKKRYSLYRPIRDGKQPIYFVHILIATWLIMLGCHWPWARSENSACSRFNQSDSDSDCNLIAVFAFAFPWCTFNVRKYYVVKNSYFINGYLLYRILCSSSRKHSKKKAKRQSNSSSDEDSPEGALFTSYVMCHQSMNIVTWYHCVAWHSKALMHHLFI